ncbi:hypothetical protein LJC63_06820 [Ruminococcaceae bacterium OttesenSCG-928-L11]|nr:hypothetical protein [Ruminococcaceae bacterium OttesenSCG-928-L11]
MSGKPTLALILAGLSVSSAPEGTDSFPSDSPCRYLPHTVESCARSGAEQILLINCRSSQWLRASMGCPNTLRRKYRHLRIVESCRPHRESPMPAAACVQYLEQFNPRTILLISGVHNCAVDYREMLAVHSRKRADLTAAASLVSWLDAFSSDVLCTDWDDRILEYRPSDSRRPISNLAAMGAYAVKWSVLKAYLAGAAAEGHSGFDLGRGMIPALLAAHKRLYSYRFHGYFQAQDEAEPYWSTHTAPPVSPAVCAEEPDCSFRMDPLCHPLIHTPLV